MKKRHLLRMGAVLSLVCLVLSTLVWTASAEKVEILDSSQHPELEHPRSQGVPGQLFDAYETDGPPAAQGGEYFRVRTITLKDGTSIDETVINGPPKPPPDWL